MSEYVPNPYSMDVRSPQSQGATSSRESALSGSYLLPHQTMPQYMPSCSPSGESRMAYGLGSPHLQQPNPMSVYGYSSPHLLPSTTLHYGDSVRAQLLQSGDKNAAFSPSSSPSVLPGIHNLYGSGSRLLRKGSAEVFGSGSPSAVQQELHGNEQQLNPRLLSAQGVADPQSLQDSAAGGMTAAQARLRGFDADLTGVVSFHSERNVGGLQTQLGHPSGDFRLSSPFGLGISAAAVSASGASPAVTSSASHRNLSSPALLHQSSAGSSDHRHFPRSMMPMQQQQQQLKSVSHPSGLSASSQLDVSSDMLSSIGSHSSPSLAANPRKALDINVGSLTNTDVGPSRHQDQGKLDKIRARAALSNREVPNASENGGMNSSLLHAAGSLTQDSESCRSRAGADKSINDYLHEKKMRFLHSASSRDTSAAEPSDDAAGAVAGLSKEVGGDCKQQGPDGENRDAKEPPVVKQEPIASPPSSDPNSTSDAPGKSGDLNAESGFLIPKFDPDVSDMKTETGSRPYVCSYCQQKFTFSESLQIHIGRDHSGLCLKSCLVCQKMFPSPDHLTAHLKVHTEKNPFKCKLCGKSFGKPCNLKRHVSTHNSDRPYHCDACGKQFISQKCRDLHLLEAHPNRNANSGQSCGTTPSSDQDFDCGVCGAHFSDIESMHKHMKVHLEEQAHECRECGERFSDATQLKDHMRVHTGTTKTHHCEICGKSFTVSGSLARHKLIHTDTKPYECKDCGKQFRSASNLQSHSVIHSGQREHKCSVCSKAFSRPDSLLRHTRVHTGARPHTCEFCPKSFAVRNHLVNHLRIHTGDRPYQCSHCGKKFSRSDSLHRHLLTHSAKKVGKKQAKEGKEKPVEDAPSEENQSS